MRTIAALALAGSLLAGPAVRGAADAPSASDCWPGWRRDGSGVAPAQRLPTHWSLTQNLRWRTPLPGEGNSSPVVWGKRLFLSAALDEGAKRLVLCLDADSGRILWTRELPREIRTLLYPKTGFAAPTPVTDGQRVYVFFDTPGLVALDMQGRVLWTKNLGPFQAPYNIGSSPIVYRDLVLQCCDHKGPSFLAAFERGTGRERWRTTRASSGFGHFGTPLVISVKGRDQVVVNGEPVVAYDPLTGEQLWTCRGMKECVGPSPVFGHGVLYASSGRTGPVMAIDPSGRGDVTETHVLMHLTSGGPYVPTPLVYPHLLIPGDNGRLLVYAGPNKPQADERVRDHFTSSPIGGDGKIYWCSERGKTYVLDAATLKVLAANELPGACLATPAIAGGRLFIRSNLALYCVEASGKADVVAVAKAISGSFAELAAHYDKHQAFWQNEAEAQIRLETLEAIARLDDPQVIPFLLRVAVKEPHWDICEEAAKSLGRKGPPAIDAILTLLPDSRPFIRTIAIQELGRMQVAKALPGLLKALSDKQPLVRSAALQAMTEIGRSDAASARQAIAAMAGILFSAEREEPVVRESALDGLAALSAQAAADRATVLRALVAVTQGANPRLAAKARDLLDRVYHATPPELRSLNLGSELD